MDCEMAGHQTSGSQLFHLYMPKKLQGHEPIELHAVIKTTFFEGKRTFQQPEVSLGVETNRYQVYVGVVYLVPASPKCKFNEVI